MRTVKKQQKILLIDISTWRGHHEIYFKKILNSLIKQKYSVYATCADNTDLRKWITNSSFQNCHVVDFKLSFIQKILYKSLVIIDGLIKEILKKPNYRFSSICSVLFANNIISQIGTDIPVFFADADTSLPAIPLWLAKILLPSQWITLAVQPSYLSAIAWGKQKSRQRFVAEKLFALPSCKAVLTLHPAYLKFFKNRFHIDKFYSLPEIIDVTDGKYYDLPQHIYQLALGRKIISITGALLPKRNLKLFLQAAQYLNPNEYFILAIGHLSKELYTQIELAAIEELSLRLVDNSYLNFDYYISEEGEFNHLLKISDVIYIQYLKHPFSSNILTKAIYLRKPVIIGDSYIMKKVVEEYQWTGVAPEEAQLIADLIMNIANNFDINEDKYNKFLLDFSDDRFNQAIDSSIKLLESKNKNEVTFLESN